MKFSNYGTLIIEQVLILKLAGKSPIFVILLDIRKWFDLINKKVKYLFSYTIFNIILITI